MKDLIYCPRRIVLSFIYGGTWFDSKQYTIAASPQKWE
jgi:hypothetical protein